MLVNSYIWEWIYFNGSIVTNLFLFPKSKWILIVKIRFDLDVIRANASLFYFHAFINIV